MRPAGWLTVTAANLGPIVTIADLAAVTGYSRRNIRDFLKRYDVQPLPRYGPHDTLRYAKQDIITAIDTMPGSGHRRNGPPP